MMPIEVGSAFRCVLSSLYIFPVLLPDFRENKIFHIQNSHSWKKFQVNTSHSAHPFCRVNENSRHFFIHFIQQYSFFITCHNILMLQFPICKMVISYFRWVAFLEKADYFTVPSSLKYLYLSRFCSWLL